MMVFKDIEELAKKEHFKPDATWILCGCLIRERGERGPPEKQCSCFLSDKESLEAAEKYLKSFGFKEDFEVKKLFMAYI